MAAYLTHLYIFRVSNNYNQRGRKYYINLDNYKTLTRINDVREEAQKYTDEFYLKMIGD